MDEKENDPISSTAYDDAFKTLLHRCSQLIIPVVNEIFGTKYSRNDRIVFLDGEFQQEKVDGTQESIRTDSIFKIYSASGGVRKYHIECQSTKDKKMLVGMFEYSTQVALIEPTEFDERQMTIKFPRSAILYLRSNSKTPDYMTVNVEVEDKKISIMQIPVMKIKNYSLEQIFEKDLLFLIPFHLFAYENKFAEYEEDNEKFEQLCKNYEMIAEKLNELVEENKVGGFECKIIYEATKRVAELLARRHEKILEGVNTMGGKIWETPETRIYDDGVAKGRAEMAAKLEAIELESKRKDLEIAAWKKKYAELARQVNKSRDASR